MSRPRALFALAAAAGLLLSACGQLERPPSEPLAVLDNGRAVDAAGTELESLAFGDVCQDATVERQVAVFAETSGRGGKTTPHTGNQIWRNGVVLTVAPAQVPSGFVATGGSIALPGTWQDLGNGARSERPALVAVSFTAGSSLGPVPPGSLKIDVSGQGTTTPTVTRSVSIALSANVVACNEAPVISIQQPLEFEGDTAGGWSFASFALIGTASDAEDGSPVVTCSPAMGAVLPLGATTVTCTATDSAGARASATGTVRVVDTTPPALTCPPAASGWVGAGVALGAASASDLVDPAPSVWSDAPASFGPGTTLVQWTAEDASGNRATCAQDVTMTYDFQRILRSKERRGMMLTTKAGGTASVRFRLGGDMGLDVFAAGYPRAQQAECSSRAAAAEAEAGPSARSLLSYDPATGVYRYQWKTDKSWAGTCQQLVLQLNDGSAPQVVNFRLMR